jgi:hypothetical protein
MYIDEQRLSELRLYDCDELPDYWRKPDVQLHIQWLNPGVVYVTDLHGTFSARTRADLLQWMQDKRVQMVRAERGRGHTLPCAQSHPDGGLVVYRDELLARLARLQRGTHDGSVDA